MCALIISTAYAILLIGCVSTLSLTVAGAPVSGEVRALSVADIEAAIGGMRSDLPQIRSQQLTEIQVIDSNTVYLAYREAGKRLATRHVVQRVRGHWHYTWEIVV